MRLSFLPLAILGACLAAVPACKKKEEGGVSGIELGGPTGTPPAAVNSEYLAFVHFRAKDVRDSAVFAEVKDAVTRTGGTAEWDKLEQQASSTIGVKPSDVDTVSAWITDVPPQGGPKFVLIVTANKAFDKGAFLRDGKTAPDSQGFYRTDRDRWMHFPDDKTLVMIHPELRQKYLDGYARNRSGWPVNAELTKAAAGHTLFAVVNMDKAPRDVIRGDKDFEAVASARSIVVTADLKGRELTVGVRATFPDAGAAGKSRDAVQEFLTQAAASVEKLMNGKGADEFTGLMPAVKEAHRALKTAKVEVSGSDLTLAAAYRADFDIRAMVTDLVTKVRDSAKRITDQNNLKQIGLVLHNYEAANGRLVIHGTGMNGGPLRNPNEKPLLSWRVALLPYIEQDNLSRQFRMNEPWDSEHNKKLIDKMPKIYAPLKPGKPGYTHMQMIVGPGAMQPSGMALTGITDGTSNTFAVVEAAEPVIWTKPDDIMMPAKVLPGQLKNKFGGQFPGGFNALFWDGSVRFIRDTISERTLELLVNPNDGQVLPRDW